MTQKLPSHRLQLVVKRLTEFFRVLSNPRRILIIEELQDEEKDVSSLAAALELEQSAISKHLAALRALKLVSERREGRCVYYRLSNPKMASWIVHGLKFGQSNVDVPDFCLISLMQTESTIQTSEERK